MIRFSKTFQLLFITTIALVGFGLSSLWLGTAQKAWKADMLKRITNQGRRIPNMLLLELWQKSENLDQTLLPGGHLHRPGLIAHLLLMDGTLPTELRSSVIDKGTEALCTALSREPADSLSWARLAWFRYLSKGAAPAVVAALRMSIYTAPAQKNLLLWRIHMAGLNLAYWDKDFEELLRRQIYLAWRISPARLNKAVTGTLMEKMVKETTTRSSGGIPPE
jgi:hypothetical protein